MRNVILFLALCLSACASLNRVPEDVQATIERRVKGQDYWVSFSHPVDNGSHMVSDINGYLWVQGDSLYFDFAHPAFKVREKFKMQEYNCSKTKKGETVITFSIGRPEKMCYKEQDKEVPVDFCLTVRAPERIAVDIDGGGGYNGRFMD